MSDGARTRKDWFSGIPANLSLPKYRSLAAVRKVVSGALKQMRRLSNGVLTAHAPRRLKVVESVPLGEKRFVSILHIDGEEFLLGGSASSVVVLAKLDSTPGAGQPFGSVFCREKQKPSQISQYSSDRTSESTR